jgi:2-polyprenyl-3-methyl-5-hydroxy-6-metoxy-1,4-benzoquinol methylase
MDLIISVKPFSVLDVGSGFGKYGVLCREYLELWDGREEYKFLRRIDGVEVFENYITPLHKYIYNNMYTENIINLVNNLDYSYDLVLLIDVLEHFSKEEGILVSTPKKPSPQQDVFGNAFEIHKSLWKKEELSTLGKHYFIRDNISHIVYITREQHSLNNLISRLKILKRSRNSSLVKSLKSTKNSIVKSLKKKLSSIPLIVRVYRKFKRN